ncbi:hypothetical protein IWW36_001696 [Coemansia brasiliensis]|uniref:Uncharacterized protein n=1 Tax=Coemansia brasiliensis TaxID=2650707 RepID=A0A9W8M0M2_9FUNG|nr:hypothetical protein IWW36_001696 [Coemansia brasiliensis]
MQAANAAVPAALRQRQRAAVGQERPKQVQQHVYPNRTIYGVETPDCYFRRFTPDGKYLIGIDRMQTGLHVFRVATASPATSALLGSGPESAKSEFWQFFEPLWARTFAGMGESLHRDLCLTTANSSHIIVARVRRAEAQEERSEHPNTLACVRAVEDISLLVIDVRTGQLVDSRMFPSDIVFLSGHSGVSILGDRLCVLSIKRQCLHLLRIGRDGHLSTTHEIGWYTREDDAIYEETLRIREARAVANISRSAKRKAAASSGCVGDANVSNKRRKLRHTRPMPIDAASSSNNRNGNVIESAIDTSTAAIPQQPSLNQIAHIAAQGTAPTNHPPFLFLPAQQQQQQSQPQQQQQQAEDTLLLSDGASIDSTFLAMERSALTPFHTLQRLPPQYRLLYARAMHPSMRMDALSDSELASLEPSLTTAPHSGLKQRLLAALFIQAQSSPAGIQGFFRSFRQYENLVLWRAQFVTGSLLLLRFVPLHVATARANVPRAHSASSAAATNFAILAEYDIVSTQFRRIWDSSDILLYKEVETRIDAYRSPMAPCASIDSAAAALSPSTSNDVHLRDVFDSTQAAIRSSRSGGLVQAARKASALLPFPPQYAQESPLLNPSIFQCNMRTRQALEKLRPVSPAPIRFYDRISGAVKFVLSPSPHWSVQMPSDDATQATMPDADPPLDISTIHGAHVLPSGAIMMSTGGDDDLDLSVESNSALPQTAPLATTSHALQQNYRANFMYLFHPTLPLVLSTRIERSLNASISTLNIHFWQPC